MLPEPPQDAYIRGDLISEALKGKMLTQNTSYIRAN
jgi:hypothetical protein